MGLTPHFLLLLVATFWLPQHGQSLELSPHHPYYGEKFYQLIQSQNFIENSSEVPEEIHRILSLWHVTKQDDFDDIVDRCPLQGCYRHHWETYKNTRQIMFGEIHLFLKNNKYSVEDVYCDRTWSEEEFSSSPPGPYKIPNHTLVNAEHTWPQSRFNPRLPKDIQKSDLHSLYPVSSRLNSSRSNDPFGEVKTITSQLCEASKKGVSKKSNTIVFEPPDNHKGNVARSLFYFSLRYQMPIDEEQEAFLRKWHQLDPVDQRELERNELVFAHQGNRNPFIDHPEIVEVISNF